jgi:Flagellar hook-length control protein FliK
MPISVNPILPVIAAQSATADLVLQAGSVVDAQVLKILSDNLVRIAIANLSIDVASEVPLAAGQALQLAVTQTPEGIIRLAVVGQGGAAAVSADTVTLAPVAVAEAASNPSLATPSSNALTPPERVAVSAAVQNAAAQQESLAPLFANLAVAATSSGLPPKLQQAVLQVLSQRTSLDTALTGSDVQKAFEKSGIFLEASLASGSASQAGIPDLKAALIVLRQTLVSALGPAVAAETPSASPVIIVPQSVVPGTVDISAVDAAPGQVAVSQQVETPRQVAATPTLTLPPSVAPSLSPEVETQEVLSPVARMPGPDDSGPLANIERILLSATPLNAGSRAAATGPALNLLQEALQPMARIVGSNVDLPAPLLQNGRNDEITFHTSTPPPPFRGALPSAQPVAAPSIAPNAPLATSAHHLLADTDAAIARQTLLQVASLPDRVDGAGARIDQAIPRWNFEIPFVTPQGTAMAQFEISRDAGGNEVEATKRVWRARFSVDVEPAGPVHALVSLNGDTTSVRMWAERPATAAQLRAGAAQLSQALSKAKLQPGDILIREGTPPQPTPARAGHFLDRAL